jgi:arylsulfatase A-like enzyme
VPARDVNFVSPLTAAPAPFRPDIYLLIVDSLCRDYVGPYNASVTFTPELARLARDSFVFDRAYTRYAGTSLAVASIWAGGMVPHALEQPAFASRNTLLKLLDANNYLRMMPVDHLIHDLVPSDHNAVQLERGEATMDIDVCATMTDLEKQVEQADPSRPVFFYALPQDVHIAIASRREVPDGESYPGFFAPVASSVRKIDTCIGTFVDFLKRTNRYDRSIVIVTSDHGDSLGEEGRWGHAYFLVPEVMRVPLIVHVPPALASGMSVDLSAVTFSSDLVPSLYALMGYAMSAPADFMGRSAFGPPDADFRWRRREPFLVASSYGAVYGLLRQNGTSLYAVDAVEGRDNAFDLADDGVGKRIEITPALTTDARDLIRAQLAEFSRQNDYHPRP